jgi:hypothetical protein
VWTSRERTAIFPEHMNSHPVLCGISRERTDIFPEHMNSPSPHKTGGEFMCSGNIAVLSLLVPHKTGGEFMCSGKIAVLCFVWD